LNHRNNTEIDAANFPAHTRRMAKKAVAKGRADSPLPAAGSQPDDGAHGVTRPTAKISLAPSDGERAGVKSEVPRPLDGRGIKGEGHPSSLLDTRVIYCGDNLQQLAKLPDACVDLIYIDPPFNSNRNYEVFWGETREKRAFEDRHESTRAYPAPAGRPRCEQLARVLKKTGSFYYHCDWHASHYAKVMPISAKIIFNCPAFCHLNHRNGQHPFQ
jgi:hypothetical protein